MIADSINCCPNCGSTALREFVGVCNRKPFVTCEDCHSQYQADMQCPTPEEIRRRVALIRTGELVVKQKEWKPK